MGCGGVGVGTVSDFTRESERERVGAGWERVVRTVANGGGELDYPEWD